MTVVVTALLVAVPPASAGNAGDQRLDAAAAAISADTSLKTYCETEQAEWDQWIAMGVIPPNTAGFTSVLNPDPLTGGHFVYVGPRACSALLAFVRLVPPERLSFRYEELGAAILVLTHEAMHQRLHSGDEAFVECNAVKYLPWVLQTVFDIRESVTVRKRERVRVKRRGRWLVKWRTVTRRVRNADYAAVTTGALLMDAGTPPQYHGASC